MKRAVLALLTWQLAITGAMAAGNFAFFVTAEPGLKLEFIGYGGDGSRIFDNVTDAQSRQQGALGYLITVDEDIIRANGVGKWCVRDASRKWSKLEGLGATDTLCDSAPSQTRGTYTFTPDRAEAQAAASPAAAEASLLRFDIAADVPQDQIDLIKTGIGIGQAYLDRVYGGGIPPDVQSTITVKVEATGKGNPDGGACCTALAKSGIRPYFDVRHPNWNQNTAGRGWTTETDNMKSVIHEYVHAWQASLGAMTYHSQPLGNWMDEGIAEYVAYGALVDAGRMTQTDADRMEFNSSLGAELGKPLKRFDNTNTPVWVGHVGYLAIEWLVASAPAGQQSLRALAIDIGKKKSVDAAFKDAFGLSRAAFYRQFEVWRTAINQNSNGAFDRRPALSLANGMVGPAATPSAEATGVVALAATPSAEATGLNATQLFELANAYDTGNGKPRDDALAAKYYQLAADQGSIAAMRNLAGMYGGGRGVAADQTRAAQLFLAAAQGGDAQAQYALANWYTQDRNKKIAWLQKAAAQNHADAIKLLGQLGIAVGQAPPTPTVSEPPTAAASVTPPGTWDIRAGDVILSGSQLRPLVVGKTAKLMFNKKTNYYGLLEYKANGHYNFVAKQGSVTKFTLAGKYRILADGRICSTQDQQPARGESCNELWVRNGTTLIKVFSSQERDPATIQ